MMKPFILLAVSLLMMLYSTHLVHADTVITTINVGRIAAAWPMVFDPSDNEMYVAVPGGAYSGSVVIISGTTLVANVTVGADPAAIAFNPSDNEVYVANVNSGSISVISGTTVVADVTVPGSPYALAFNPSDNEMYVANYGTSTVSIISGTTLVDTVKVGLGPTAFAFNSYNNEMYVANNGCNGSTCVGSVSVISGTTVVANVTLGGSPDGLAFNPSNNDMYVTNSISDTISVMSGTMVVANVTAGVAGPFGLAFNPSDDEMYVANGVTGIFVISGTTIVANVTLPGALPGLSALAFDPSNNEIYAADYGSNTVSVVSGTALVGIVTVGFGPYQLVFNPSDNEMYVYNTNYASSLITVSVIRTGPFPDFAVTASPRSITTEVNAPAVSTISLTATNGFSGVVSLSDNPIPSNLTCTAISPGTLSGSENATVSCKSGIVGAYTLTITATSGYLVRTTTLQVTVTSSNLPNFNLSATPASVIVGEGVTGITTITVAPLNGFSGSVMLSTSTSPATGLSCLLSGTIITDGSGSSRLSCSGSAGSYTVTVTATSGSLSHSVQIPVSVASRTSSQTNSPMILGLAPALFYGAIGGIATIIIIIGVATILFRRKRN